MATETAHAAPGWFVAPGDGDTLAWFTLALVCLAIYGLITLYAAFDRWAEHQAQGTPLAKTIPTLLTIALLYEIFPLGHFTILLPIAAILIALMADWSRFHLNNREAEPVIASEMAEAPPSDPVLAETELVPDTASQPGEDRKDV